jgi:hypothetical protein
MRPMDIATLIQHGASLAIRGERGRDWYHNAGTSIAHYSEAIGVPFERACDVIAILSPRVQVAHNVSMAREYLETGNCPRAMKARQAALAQYELDGIVRGPKIAPFAEALRGSLDAVVVDTWILRAFGYPSKVTRKQRDMCETLTRAVASRLGWFDSETQAAVWVGVRETSGHSDVLSPLNMGRVN